MTKRAVMLTGKNLLRIGSRIQVRVVGRRADGGVILELTERKPVVILPGAALTIDGNVFTISEEQPRSHASARIEVETELEVRIIPIA